MKTEPNGKKKSQQAHALLTVMIMAGISITVYASVAQWTSSSAVINDRNNTYNSSVAAAEGASEQALTYLARDFLSQSFDPANLNYYRGQIPTNPWAARYQFGDGAGGVTKRYINCSPTMS